MEQQETAEKKRSRKALEDELNEASDHIERHLTALQEEFSTLGPSLGKALLRHPLVSVGGALLAGLVVGLIFGKKKQPPDPFGGRTAHRALVEQYVDAIVEEARHQIKRGAETGEAVRAALKERVPVIVLEAEDTPAQSGVLRQAGQILFRSVLGFGMTMGVNYLSNFIAGNSVAESPRHEAGPADAAVATASVSEGTDS